MTSLDVDTILGWRGRTVRDPQGDKVGKLGDLYLDAETDVPAYAGVRTGLFGTHESIVPLKGVTEEEDGDLRVPFAAEIVRSAPKLDPDAVLSPGEEWALEEHYGLRPDPNELIRSEEEVDVGVAPMQPAERVKLKKVLVTEHVKVTEPRRREVVQLETEPAPEGRIESVEPVDEDVPPR